VSVVPVFIDRDDGEESRCQQLLALRELRRGVERFAPPCGAQRQPAMVVKATTKKQLARELNELIAALDRRVPQLERINEASIARDAAALKAKALKRLAELR
jgi:hypothetical protein